MNKKRLLAFCLAGVFIVLAFSQAFALAGFIKIIQNSLGLGSKSLAVCLALAVVSLEISALPFLLNLGFGCWVQRYSLVAGWLSLGSWFFIAIWANIMQSSASIGLLGAKMSLPTSWGLVGLLGVLLLSLFLLTKDYRKK